MEINDEKRFDEWFLLKGKLHYSNSKPLISEGDVWWYVSFIFQNKNEYAAILHLKNVDVSRLYGRIGRIPNSDLNRVRIGIIKLLLKGK